MSLLLLLIILICAVVCVPCCLCACLYDDDDDFEEILGKLVTQDFVRGSYFSCLYGSYVLDDKQLSL